MFKPASHAFFAGTLCWHHTNTTKPVGLALRLTPLHRPSKLCDATKRIIPFAHTELLELFIFYCTSESMCGDRIGGSRQLVRNVGIYLSAIRPQVLLEDHYFLKTLLATILEPSVQ